MLPIITFMGGAELYVRSLPNIYKYKYKWMEVHAEEVEILSFGSSHGLNGINPIYLDGVAFNLAFPSQTPKYDLYLLQKWGDRYKKLKTVIVPIDYFTFFFDEPLGGMHTPCYYNIYMSCPYHRGFSFYSMEFFSFRALHGKIVTLMENNWQPMSDENGFLNGEPTLKDLDWDSPINTRKVVRLQTGSVNCYEENLIYLEKMADFCMNHKVKMVLVSLPMWHTFNEEMDKEQLNIMYQGIDRLKAQYKLPFLDYRTDDRFIEDDFNDIQHLSLKGAEKFTMILMKDIQKKK